MTSSIRIPASSNLPQVGGRPVRLLAKIGLPLLVIGLLGSTVEGSSGDGAFWVLVGAAMLVPSIRERFAIRRMHQEDVAEAGRLAVGLRAGELPPSVEPAALRGEGMELEPGESCFVDGVAVEVMTFYGDPIVQRQGFVFAWGSLFAWVFTAIANYLWWSHNRSQARKAAPRWRDAEAARLWVTDRRYILRSGASTGAGTFFQLPWDLMSRITLVEDGIRMVLDGRIEQPYKIRLANPAWHYTLLRRLADGRI